MKTVTAFFFAAISLILLSACQPAATPVPTETSTENPTFTQILVPTMTDTPSATATATITSTGTPMPTPTPLYNQPGVYPILKCKDFQPIGIRWIVSFCVMSVKVFPDLTMQFNVTWRTYVDTRGQLGTTWITHMNNISLSDNLQNEYRPIGFGGGAEKGVAVSTTPGAGWFLFPAPIPGATVFTLWDNDNRVGIQDIVLSPDQNLYPPTFTPTFHPDAVFNGPGSYGINKCAYYPSWAVFAEASKVRLCLKSVAVNEDYEMRFYLTWIVSFAKQTAIIKASDANNRNIMLVDNLGNEYHHIQTGGCAAQDTTLLSGSHKGGSDECSGWFQFPPAKPGAISFRFLYEDLLSFENISLAGNPG